MSISTNFPPLDWGVGSNLLWPTLQTKSSGNVHLWQPTLKRKHSEITPSAGSPSPHLHSVSPKSRPQRFTLRPWQFLWILRHVLGQCWVLRSLQLKTWIVCNIHYQTLYVITGPLDVINKYLLKQITGLLKETHMKPWLLHGVNHPWCATMETWPTFKKTPNCQRTTPDHKQAILQST